MPIYEFACPKCRVIFNFFSQRVSPKRLPMCPKCGNKKMEKQMSSFAMPRGAKEEDGFVYLSDPFIRRLVGPQVKLAERRRVLCYNHLRMIGHAALFHLTQHGKPPESLAELAKAHSAPGEFGKGRLACPDGGEYTLAPDGLTAVCSHHGHAHTLIPCCEIPLTEVTGDEAEEYKSFLAGYNQYWRTYFDPIAVRIQVRPTRYRIETIVLPLIDNSVYSVLAQATAGPPSPLDVLPIPKRNIFSVAVRFNKLAVARFLGVDPNTVRSWEQGTRLPSSIARRFMGEIEEDPTYWRQRVAHKASD